MNRRSGDQDKLLTTEGRELRAERRKKRVSDRVQDKDMHSPDQSHFAF